MKIEDMEEFVRLTDEVLKNNDEFELQSYCLQLKCIRNKVQKRVDEINGVQYKSRGAKVSAKRQAQLDAAQRLYEIGNRLREEKERIRIEENENVGD